MKKYTFKIILTLTIVLWGIIPTMAQSDYGTDVIVNNIPTASQRQPSLAIASNGWLYAAYVTTVASVPGLDVYKSTNNGTTWSSFYTYSGAGFPIDECKVMVCGTAPYKVMLGMIYHNTTTGYYTLRVSEYNGTTNAHVGIRFDYTTTTAYPIIDFDMVADDLFPSVGSTPYGVGILYSRRGPVTDSIKFVYSTNGGTNFATPVVVGTTSAYTGKVSLAYARSWNYSNGRYNAAWEQKSSSTARTGRILWARNTTYIYSPFTTPVYLDVEGATNGKCCNPKIACQFNNTDNDSTNVTAVVLMERAYTATDNDIIGYYSNRAASTGGTWHRLDVDNSGATNSKQPDINYDSYVNNFLVTYWDSTHTYLPYVLHGFNMGTTASTWPVYSVHYNDNIAMGSLLQPYPIVEINNAVHQVAFLWSRQGTGGNGVMMYDAEYSTVRINELITYNNNKINNIYPNPAYGAANIEIELSKSAKVEINAYDMSGKKISNLYNAQTSEGISTISFDVSNLANGNYVIEMFTSDSRTTSKLMVAHQ